MLVNVKYMNRFFDKTNRTAQVNYNIIDSNFKEHISIEIPIDAFNNSQRSIIRSSEGTYAIIKVYESKKLSISANLAKWYLLCVKALDPYHLTNTDVLINKFIEQDLVWFNDHFPGFEFYKYVSCTHNQFTKLKYIRKNYNSILNVIPNL